MAKRKIFSELMEGVQAMKKHREGKITLRNYKMEPEPLPAVDSKFIRETRRRMRCSRAVFARKLRINERTLEKREQGESPETLPTIHQPLLSRNRPNRHPAICYRGVIFDPHTADNDQISDQKLIPTAAAIPSPRGIPNGHRHSIS